MEKRISNEYTIESLKAYAQKEKAKQEKKVSIIDKQFVTFRKVNIGAWLSFKENIISNLVGKCPMAQAYVSNRNIENEIDIFSKQLEY